MVDELVEVWKTNWWKCGRRTGGSVVDELVEVW